MLSYPVQLDYSRLALQLTADGQILGWDWGVISTNTATNSIVVDNTDPGVVRVGTWSTSSESPNPWGANYTLGSFQGGTVTIRDTTPLTRPVIVCFERFSNQWCLAFSGKPSTSYRS